MQRFKTKLKVSLWYLKRPKFYLQFFREVISGLFPPPDTRKEAERWCQERAISTSEAIAKITGLSMYEPISEKFNDVFVTAEEIARTCPVKMGGAGDIDLLYWISEHLEAKNVIETGVAYGWSSLAILLSLTNRSNSLLLSTDMPYPKLNNQKYVGCVVPVEFKSHWEIINREDRYALPKALGKLQTIDMCHYDSDKRYKGKMWAYPRLWRALRAGGYFVSDDIGDNLAFHDFCNRINSEPIIVQIQTETRVKYVGILVKNNFE